MSKEQAISRYIRTIRNVRKRNYAERWLRFRVCRGEQPHRGNLSFMAAQAVEMRLNELLGSSESLLT